MLKNKNIIPAFLPQEIIIDKYSKKYQDKVDSITRILIQQIEKLNSGDFTISFAYGIEASIAIELLTGKLGNKLNINYVDPYPSVGKQVLLYGQFDSKILGFTIYFSKKDE